MKDWMKKVLSRKFWMAVAGVATGVAMVLGGDATEIQTVAGTVTALVSTVTYIFVEGGVDRAALGQGKQDGD